MKIVLRKMFEKDSIVLTKDTTKIGRRQKERLWNEVIGNVGMKEQVKNMKI